MSATKIPEPLRELDQWVAWVKRDSKKPPINPRTGDPASPTDPTTWADYETAVKAMDLLGCSGVGFMFSEKDPFTGGDLDHCRNPQTGVIEPWARKIIENLDSYTEISPSGTGVHILIQAKLAGGGRRKNTFEVYSQDRYFTMTGDHLEGTPITIEARQRELISIFSETFSEQKRLSKPTESGTRQVRSSGITDNDILNAAFSSKNGDKFRRLWEGQWKGDYTSHSEADQALCNHLAFYTGRDPSRIDSLFRQSGLMRKKWDREDYRNPTVSKATTSSEERWNPRRSSEKMRNVEWIPVDQLSKDRYHATDVGNGRRLVDRHGKDIRHVFEWGWMVWDGTHWIHDSSGEVVRRAKETVRSIYEEAGQTETTAKDRC